MNDPMIIEALRKVKEVEELLRIVVTNNERAAVGLAETNNTTDMEGVNLAFLDQRLDELDFGPGFTNRLQWMFKNYQELDARNRWVANPLITVRDLVVLREADVMREVNVGRACLNRLKAMLAPHGLHFEMKLPMGVIAKQENHAVQ